MAIRIPTQGLLDVTNTSVGVGSVAGGFAYPFTVSQDTDTIVVRFRPSVITGNMSATLQSSPDGGSTWYDLARTSVLSNANAVTAQWLVGTTITSGMRTAVTQAASVITAGVGSAAASTLGSQQVSGLPILGTANRVFLIMGGGVTVNDGSRVEVFVPQQSATA